MSKVLCPGTGYARGFEISAQKTSSEKWSWLIDYSYSVVKFRALDGVLRNGDFDFRHVLNALVSFRISSTLEASLKWRLVGGQPYTPFDMTLSEQKNGTYFDMTRINTLRYPVYHSLDLRLEKRFVFKKWSLNTSIDVQNLYNRKNVYYKFWDDGQEHTVYYLPIIPLIGIQAGF
jgi:outer membrane receptor for ferrienterochelin and colicin